METNKIFMDVAQRAREFAEMCERMANETKQKSDPEAWREEYRNKQAAGVKFAVKTMSGEWVLNHKQVSSISDNHVVGVDFNFEGKKEDYREVPLEQPAIGVISSFNKWDRALTEKEISDLFSGKVRPEDIPQEAPKIKEIGIDIEPQPVTPHAAERALYWAQRVAGTNEIWQEIYEIGTVITTYPVDKEPAWDPNFTYRVKPMKLTAKIISGGVCKIPYYWEFTGTREEYRAECEKYGYVVVSEIKEVKPKTVKNYSVLVRLEFPTIEAANDYVKGYGMDIIGDIEEREIEA